MVSFAKRRKILATQRTEARADQAATEAAIELAGIAVFKQLPLFVDNGTPCGPAVMAKIHGSHECITCGGFVGCNRCGSVVSTAQ